MPVVLGRTLGMKQDFMKQKQESNNIDERKKAKANGTPDGHRA